MQLKVAPALDEDHIILGTFGPYGRLIDLVGAAVSNLGEFTESTFHDLYHEQAWYDSLTRSKDRFTESSYEPNNANRIFYRGDSLIPVRNAEVHAWSRFLSPNPALEQNFRFASTVL